MKTPTIKNHNEEIIGYKAFKKDERGKLYTDGLGSGGVVFWEEGEIKEILEKPVLCEKGFHFFRHYFFAIDYLETGNAIHKVRSLGEVQEDTHKCVTNKIEILELIYEETDKKRNSGVLNSGDYNSGNGYRNYFCTETKYFLFDTEVPKEKMEMFNEIDFSWFCLERPGIEGYKEAWSRIPKKILNQIKKTLKMDSEQKNKFFEITGIKV